MSRDNPREVSPAGKPKITVRASVTPMGGLSHYSGHGVGYGQVCAERSFTGKSNVNNGATPKGKLTIHTGHGTEYGQESSRG